MKVWSDEDKEESRKVQNVLESKTRCRIGCRPAEGFQRAASERATGCALSKRRGRERMGKERKQHRPAVCDGRRRAVVCDGRLRLFGGGGGLVGEGGR